MATRLHFPCSPNKTLSANACLDQAYTGTAANTVAWQTGTCRYIATFNTNLPVGLYRLDYLLTSLSAPLGDEMFSVDEDGGDFYPLSDAAIATILQDIQDQTDLIGTSGATISAPVSADGVIEKIVIGDDYLDANGRAFTFTDITEPTGFVAATSTATFGGKSLNGDGGTWSVAGVITDGGATWTIKFDLPKAQTSSLACGLYGWSVEIKNADGTEHTVVISSDDDEPTRLVEKYT